MTMTSRGVVVTSRSLFFALANYMTMIFKGMVVTFSGSLFFSSAKCHNHDIQRNDGDP